MKATSLILLGTLMLGWPAWAAPNNRQEPVPRSLPTQSPDPIRLYNQGVELLKQKQFAEAQQVLERVLQIDDDFPQAHNNLAYTLRKQGEEQFDRALSHYTQAIELDPTLPEPYMYRGVLHVQMGNLELAEADLEQLKELESPLVEELTYVIEQGQEKEPEQFFGVSAAIQTQ